MIKELDQRISEIVEMKTKLLDLDLSEEFDGIKQFYHILDEFERGINSSGSIKLIGLNRILEYKLSMKHYIKSTLVLKYDKYI